MQTRHLRFAPRVLLGFALAAGTAATALAGPQDASARGKALFETHCAFCHGTDGRAETSIARLLDPRPRNLADPVEMARLTTDQVYHAIKEGKPATAMAAWGEVLSEPQIGDIMDYVRTLTPTRLPGMTADQLSIEVGRRIYKRDCAFCHGTEGRADTEAAKVLKPRPRIFADPIEMARVDDGRLYAAIKLGRAGTSMASWGELLSPAEIIDVMRFIRSLEQPLPPGMTRAQLEITVGEGIYKQYCITCHGEQGNAQTPLGHALNPHPVDFTKAHLTDIEMQRAISLGKPGTAMAPWGVVLNSEDARRVILYIRQTFQH